MGEINDQSISANTVFTCILSRTNQYLNTRHIKPPSSPATPLFTRIHVDFPEPPPILSALVAAGAKLEVAHAIQVAYHQRACEFRERALTTISRAYSRLAQIPSRSSHSSSETIIAAFKQVYFKKLNSWISESVALLQAQGPVLRCREDNGGTPLKTSKTFNHQYVHLLEQFFEENPFPTHVDKVFLAKKSSMTYRQIHVWFQNRRNRTKKILHKKLVSEETTVPFDTLIHKMGKSATPPTAKQDIPSNSQSILVSSSTKVSDDLGGVAPQHAFPTPYPPSCKYNPFPGVPIFTVPEWSRRPVIPSQRLRQSNMDIDELIEKFTRLNVRDETLSRSRRKNGKVTCDSFAATFAITVRPSPAPHPACIRTAVIPPTPPRVICRPVPTPAYALHAFRSPSPGSSMMTLVPPHVRRRKICPIPKRAPSKPPFFLDRESSEHSNASSSLASSIRSSSVGTETSTEDSESEYNRTSNTSSPVSSS